MSALALVWCCQRCDKPIADDDGYLHVNYAEINHVQRETAAWHKRHPAGTVISGAELFTHPGRAPWQAHHRACDPRPESNDYWIGVERIRTHLQVVKWTAHLMEKNWLEHTSWIDVLRGVAYGGKA